MRDMPTRATKNPNSTSSEVLEMTSAGDGLDDRTRDLMKNVASKGWLRAIGKRYLDALEEQSQLARGSGRCSRRRRHGRRDRELSGLRAVRRSDRHQAHGSGNGSRVARNGEEGIGVRLLRSLTPILLLSGRSSPNPVA